MAATRKQLLRVMERGYACGPSFEWVERTKGSPRELWAKCRNGEWMAWLVEELARMGGGHDRWKAWFRFNNKHCYGCDASALCPHLIRKHVPWHMVDAAIQREGSK